MWVELSFMRRRLGGDGDWHFAFAFAFDRMGWTRKIGVFFFLNF